MKSKNRVRRQISINKPPRAESNPPTTPDAREEKTKRGEEKRKEEEKKRKEEAKKKERKRRRKKRRREKDVSRGYVIMEDLSRMDSETHQQRSRRSDWKK